MNRQPAVEGTLPRHYSPDGRWYWDGARWLPVPPPVPPGSAGADDPGGIGTRSWAPAPSMWPAPPAAPQSAGVPAAPPPGPAGVRTRRRGLVVGLLVAMSFILVATPVVLGIALAGVQPPTSPRATPAPVVNPGTYAAGTLEAPASLAGYPRTGSMTRTYASELRQDRDALARAAGGPAIAAGYGPVYLRAAQGYLTDDQFFGSSQATYVDFGPVRCGTIMDTICFRSDETQHLVVAVEALTDNPQSLAGTANAAWTDLGGH